MSRSTAVLVSAVITGFLMVIATAIAMGVPGAGASDKVASGDPEPVESVAVSQELAGTNDQFADQFSTESVIAEALSTQTPVPTAPPAPPLPPEQSDAYLDLEWEMLLAQDRIAELTALNLALQDREVVYVERMEEANAAIQEISESWSRPAEVDESGRDPLTSSAPSDQPTAEPSTVDPTATAMPDPTPQPTPEPTPTPEPLSAELLPGEEVTTLVGDVATLIGTRVLTNKPVLGKAAVIDWGDGTSVQPATVIQESGEILGFHVYREPGSYVVFVTVYVDHITVENWTLIIVDEPEPLPTPVPTATPAPAPTVTPLPVATPTPSQPAPPPPANQPFGITFDDAAYIGRAISGELWIEQIKIKHEDGQQMFEVELDEAKVFIDTDTGVILYGEHILSSPVNPVPEPPAGMMNFDDAYSIAVNAHPGSVTEMRQTRTTYRVRVSGVDIRIDAYTGAIQ